MIGANQAGLYPVLYEDRSVPSKIHEKNDSIQVDFPYLMLDNWQELIDLI